MVPYGGGRNFDIQKKSPRNGSVLHFSSKLDVPSNVVQNKRVAQILVFKIRPSQEILKIRDGTPLEAEGILIYRKKPSKWIVFKIRPSQEILKIRDDVPSNVVQKKRVAWILVLKIRSSQEILKIRDAPLEAEGILTYKKKPSKWIGFTLFYKLDVPSNVVQKKRVARILVFKMRPSQEILKIRDGTHLEAEGILTYRKKPSKWIVSSQEILKIRDGTPLEAEGILTYKKKPSKWIGFTLFYKLDVPSNVVQKKRVARILVFKMRPSQEILKIRDGTPLEAEGILTYRKNPRNGSVWHFSSKLDVPSNVVHKKRVERILVFKIRPSQEILKIRDGIPLEAEGILTYKKKPSKWIDVPSNVVQKKRVAQILVFKIRPSQEILKIRDGTPLEAEGILTYKKKPSKWIGFTLFYKLDVPSNVVQKKRVARILVFKMRPSQEILKIRDGTPLEAEGILTYRKKPSKWIEILKIRDAPLEAEGILTYKKKPSKWIGFTLFYKLDVPSNVVQKKRVAWILVFKIKPSQEILKIRDPFGGGRNFDIQKKTLEMDRVARILVFKIRPSQEILKIRDGIPLEAEGILTYRKKPSKWIDVPSNVVQKKRVAWILVLKIRSSQEILKIRDAPLEAEGILTYKKKPSKWIGFTLFYKLDVPSNVVQKKRVARILVFKMRPSQEILKIRDGTPLEAEGILTYRKKPSKWIESSQEILKIRDAPLEAEGILTYKKKPSKWIGFTLFYKLDVPSNVVQKKRVARVLVFKMRPSQEILKIRDGTPLEAEGILTYRKKPSKWIVFKIRPSQEILKIRDGTPLESGRNFDIQKKSPRNRSVWHFSNKLDVPSNVVQKKRVAWILVLKIRPSQEILKIRDGTPLEAEGILTYRKKPSKRIDVPSNVVQKKRVAWILVLKIRSSQEILKIRDAPLEAEGILTYKKKPSKWIGFTLFYKLDVPSNVVQKKRVARILVFKMRPSQEILKIRDGTPLEAEGILTYRKKPSKWIVFKIRPSQEILKIRDGTPLEYSGRNFDIQKKSPRNRSVWHFSNKLDVPSNVVQKKRVAWILVLKIRPSQEILKIRDGTPLEAEGILTYRKKPSKRIEILKIHVPSNVVQKKRVAWILVLKIRSSQEILKIRDAPLEAEGILTYKKKPSKWIGFTLFYKLDVPSNVVQKKRVARILVFKMRPSQEILKIRDGTPLEAEGILTYRKKPSKWIVARILVFKIRPSQEILKIRDGTPLESGRNFDIQKKSPRNRSVWHFSNKLDVPSNVVQKKRVAWILVLKIRPSQEILKIRDGTPLEAEGILTYRKKSSKRIVQKKRVAWILVLKIRSSQEILKIRDGTPLEAKGILTYKKKPSKWIGFTLFYKLDVPSNVVQKKRVARILVFKMRPSQEILKIRDGTPLEAEGILTYRKKPSKWIEILKIRDVARILVFKIRPSQEILKIRDGTPLEAEGILTYRKKPSKWIDWHFSSKPSQEILKIRDGTVPYGGGRNFDIQKKSPRNRSVWHFSNKLDVPSNVVQKKRVAWILVLKIRPSQEILKIRDGTPLEAEGILTYRKKPSKRIDVPSNVVQKKRVAWILVLKIRSSQEILKIRDAPLEAEGILTYKKKPSKWIGFTLFYKLDVPSNVVQKKRVARILVFKMRPSQEILKIRDGTPLEAEGILTYRKKPSKWIVFKIRPSQEILKIRDGTPLESGRNFDIQKKSPRNRSVWHFSNKLDVPSNVVQKKRVAWILVLKIRPSQEILKIRDGTPLEAEGILTYRKKPSKRIDVPSNVVQKKRVAWILVLKIRSSQEILKIRDAPLEAEGILTYKKKPSKWIGFTLFYKLDVPSNVVQKKRVARILVFKMRPSQEILKIRDGTPLEAEGILTYRKKPSKWIVFKIRPSQEILKIRDGTPLEYSGRNFDIQKKSPRNRSVWHFSNKLDVPSNVVQKKRVAWILVLKIRPSQEILKIRDGTPLEAEGILTYRKKPSKRIEILKIHVPSNVVQKKRVAWILVLKIRSSQEILKIRDGTPLEAKGILTYKKKPSKWIGFTLFYKLDVPSNVVQKKRVARILVFKMRPSQEILKIRDGTPLEAEGILTYRKKPSKWIGFALL
ncbi:hypothetical protein OROHE_020110 [Orobanche hederae]